MYSAFPYTAYTDRRGLMDELFFLPFIIIGCFMLLMMCGYVAYRIISYFKSLKQTLIRIEKKLDIILDRDS